MNYECASLKYSLLRVDAVYIIIFCTVVLLNTEQKRLFLKSTSLASTSPKISRAILIDARNQYLTRKIKQLYKKLLKLKT